MFPQTKTEIAKMMVQMAVCMKVTQVTNDQLAQHTEINTDGIPAKVGSSVVGYLVAQQLSPFTDKAVDIVVERFQSWKKDKKSSTDE